MTRGMMLAGHLVPLDDLIDHEDHIGCVCGPAVEPVDGGSILVTHHPLDGREVRDAND